MKNPYVKITEIKKTKVTDAQKSLWDGLVSLWKRYSIYQVSIKQLCQESHVARSTFYVYYQNIEDIVEEIENYHIYNILELNKEIMENRNALEEPYAFYQSTMNYIDQNKQVFYAFLISNPNMRL